MLWFIVYCHWKMPYYCLLLNSGDRTMICNSLAVASWRQMLCKQRSRSSRPAWLLSLVTCNYRTVDDSRGCKSAMSGHPRLVNNTTLISCIITRIAKNAAKNAAYDINILYYHSYREKRRENQIERVLVFISPSGYPYCGRVPGCPGTRQQP